MEMTGKNAMTRDPHNGNIAPSGIDVDIGAMLAQARDMLAHEHSLFRTLNIDPQLLGTGRTSFALDLPETFADRSGTIHSGLATIIMDSMMGVSVLTALRRLVPIATINLRTDFLYAAPAGARARCACACDDIVDDVAYVTSHLSLEDGTAIARATGTFMVGTKGPVIRGEKQGARL